MRRYIPDEDIDNQMAMIAGLHAAATDGDARAAAVLVKLLGEETPAEKLTPPPADDGFVEALQQQASDVWKEGSDDPG